jgi:hypothetical protein
LALAVPLSRFTSRVGGGSAFFVRHRSHAVKKIILAFIFVLGAFEMVLPILAAAHRYAFDPVFARAFDMSKFTDEQHQAYRQFRIAAASDLGLVFYCGIATIVLGILFMLADKKRSHDA